ncbi:MAG: CBS domain-containing protein [Bradyrhizobium sp.]|uniref:CBS domain-containing protein n=1 Tax=Bradyrhizobium sp. TaxID=376 RepID=UPI003BF0E794
MRAHQIMTRDVITVGPRASVVDAATIMLRGGVSGLPVVDEQNRLVGVISEGDFLRRSEIGTGHKRPRLLEVLAGPVRLARDFVQEHGTEVQNVMTHEVVSVSEDAPLEEVVHRMERNAVKRLPVMRGGSLVGIITRTNILRAIAGLAREIPDPTADDDHIRVRIARTVNAATWRPLGFQVSVHDGVVHLHGVVASEEARQATIVAAKGTSGVKKIYDEMGYLDPYSGFFTGPPPNEASSEVTDRASVAKKEP